MPPIFRLPKSSDRIVICGQTGSGKTQAAVWHLSMQDIETRPWIIFDYKDDELINGIEKAQVISYGDKLPKEPGIYILKCMSEEDDLVTEFLWRVHAHGGIGLYFDEGYMVGMHNKAFNACQMQGRSLRIPMITLTQRPVKVSPWVFSEANFWQVFDLIKRQDREKVADDVPISVDYELPEYHSYYYDVGKKQLTKLQPVPKGDLILAAIDKRLPRRRRRL